MKHLRLLERAAAALLATALIPAAGAAQERDPFVRLSRSVRYDVEVLLDSARLAGLPTAPIESKVLEGLSRKQDDRRILMVARKVYGSLREARSVLGPTATADELSTAGSALRAGIPTAELAKLTRARQGKSITVPLVVMMDLMTRGVPRDTASSTIFLLWQRGAVDDDLYGLWRGVERDIVSGTDPGVALLNRAREIPPRGTSPVQPPPSSGRPESSETQDR